MPRPVSERTLVFLIGAVQFINILDFVMVTPLGPDFAGELGIPLSYVGVIGGSYTAAASVSGVVGSYILDRFDRRKALAVAMLGLVLGTAAGGWATGLYSLLATRVLAGLFGGPATSLSLAIIMDLIPEERRGRALGAVMGAFSVASVLGVPAALEVSRLWNWTLPFFLVGGLGLLVTAGVTFLLPPLRGHLHQGEQPARPVSGRELLTRGDVRLSYAMTALTMMSGFLIIPNISAYAQRNLGYPRAEVGIIYLVGGLVSFVTLRVSGKLVDRLGSFRVGTLSSVLYLLALYLAFIHLPRWMPVVLILSSFFLALGMRNVAHHTLASRVPEAALRGRFMSLQSAIQHLASAAGAFLSAQLLTDLPDGKLGGMPWVVLVAMVLTLALPVVFFFLERRLRARGEPPPASAPTASEGLPLDSSASPRV